MEYLLEMLSRTKQLTELISETLEQNTLIYLLQELEYWNLQFCAVFIWELLCRTLLSKKQNVLQKLGMGQGHLLLNYGLMTQLKNALLNCSRTRGCAKCSAVRNDESGTR